MNDIQIRPERANHPQVGAQLDQLDACPAGSYAPKHSHILAVQALPKPVRLCERRSFRRRAAFGGYADNGLGVFHGNVLA